MNILISTTIVLNEKFFKKSITEIFNKILKGRNV